MDWNLFSSFLTSATEVRILLSPEMFHSHMFLSASTFSAAQHVGIIKIWHWLLVLMHLLVLEKPGYSSSSFLFLSLSWPPIPFPQRCYAAHAAHAAHALTHTHTHLHVPAGLRLQSLCNGREMPLRTAVCELVFWLPLQTFSLHYTAVTSCSKGSDG